LGVTWSDSVMLSTCDLRSGSRTYIVSSPEGVLGVSWTDSKYGCAGFVGCSILFKRSSDNGLTWSDEQILTETPWGDISVLSYKPGNLLSSWPGGRGVESRLSTDNGVTWSNLCTVADTGGYPGNTLSTTRALVAWERRRGDVFVVSVRAGTLPTVSVVSSPKELSQTFRVYQPFPNPFNGSVTFKYELAARSRIQMKIYNTLGQQVANLDEGERDIGEHSIVWQADAHSSGLYVYVVTAGKNVQTGKIIVLR